MMIRGDHEIPAQMADEPSELSALTNACGPTATYAQRTTGSPRCGSWSLPNRNAPRLSLSQATSFSETAITALTNEYFCSDSGSRGFRLCSGSGSCHSSRCAKCSRSPQPQSSLPLLSGLISRDFPPTLYCVGITLVIIGLMLVVMKQGTRSAIKPRAFPPRSPKARPVAGLTWRSQGQSAAEPSEPP
jgi:hypothetical protein